ncbi:unnamed protein product, partial [marine sediment metagenome]
LLSIHKIILKIMIFAKQFLSLFRYNIITELNSS